NSPVSFLRPAPGGSGLRSTRLRRADSAGWRHAGATSQQPEESETWDRNPQEFLCGRDRSLSYFSGEARECEAWEVRRLVRGVLAELRSAARAGRSRPHLSCSYGPLFQDFRCRRDRGFQFLIFGVEVGCHAHAGFGAIVDQDVPLEKFAADLLGVGHFDRNRSAAVFCFARGIHTLPVSRGQFDQSRSLPFRFLPNALNADLGDDLQSGARGFQGWYVGGAIHEAIRGLAVASGSGFEGKGVLVGK